MKTSQTAMFFHLMRRLRQILTSSTTLGLLEIYSRFCSSERVFSAMARFSSSAVAAPLPCKPCPTFLM